MSAFETYRALYHDQIFPIRVAELLILEQRMPRSLAACSFQINNALGHIVGQHDHAAKRLAVELLARLTHADIEEIFQDGLHEFLMSVLADIIELGNRIQRAWPPTMSGARTSRCIIWWRMLRGVTRRCWRRCGGRY